MGEQRDERINVLRAVLAEAFGPAEEGGFTTATAHGDGTVIVTDVDERGTHTYRAVWMPPPTEKQNL